MPADLKRQIRRFIVVGAFTTIAYIVTIEFCVRVAGLPITAGAILSVIAACVVSYLLNHSWTFEKTGNHAFHLKRYLQIAVTGSLVNWGLVEVLVYRAGLPYLLIAFASAAVLAVVNFVLFKIYAFRDKGAAD